MPLPKIDIPTYTLELPSTKEELTYRPFLVKEEKILLMAMQGGTSDEIVRGVKQIITNCILTEGIEVEKLPIYDLEYIFLQIRIKSVGSSLQLRFMAREGTDCEECRKPRSVTADLTQAKVVYNPDHSNKISLGDNLYMTMTYPGIKLIGNFDKSKEDSQVEEYYKLIWKCIVTIHDAEKTYSTKDYSLADGIEFLETLRQDQFAKIEEFLKTMPKLKLDVPVVCEKCEFNEIFTIEGLENFFV